MFDNDVWLCWNVIFVHVDIYFFVLYYFRVSSSYCISIKPNFDEITIILFGHMMVLRFSLLKEKTRFCKIESFYLYKLLFSLKSVIFLRLSHQHEGTRDLSRKDCFQPIFQTIRLDLKTHRKQIVQITLTYLFISPLCQC